MVTAESECVYAEVARNVANLRHQPLALRGWKTHDGVKNSSLTRDSVARHKAGNHEFASNAATSVFVISSVMSPLTGAVTSMWTPSSSHE